MACWRHRCNFCFSQLYSVQKGHQILSKRPKHRESASNIELFLVLAIAHRYFKYRIWNEFHLNFAPHDVPPSTKNLKTASEPKLISRVKKIDLQNAIFTHYLPRGRVIKSPWRKAQKALREALIQLIAFKVQTSFCRFPDNSADIIPSSCRVC